MPADVSIEHTIELRDNTPVSTQPRRIPYSQREEIQKKIDELIENDFVEPLKIIQWPISAKNNTYV